MSKQGALAQKHGEHKSEPVLVELTRLRRLQYRIPACESKDTQRSLDMLATWIACQLDVSMKEFFASISAEVELPGLGALSTSRVSNLIEAWRTVSDAPSVEIRFSSPFTAVSSPFTADSVLLAFSSGLRCKIPVGKDEDSQSGFDCEAVSVAKALSFTKLDFISAVRSGKSPHSQPVSMERIADLIIAWNKRADVADAKPNAAPPPPPSLSSSSRVSRDPSGSSAAVAAAAAAASVAPSGSSAATAAASILYTIASEPSGSLVSTASSAPIAGAAR